MPKSSQPLAGPIAEAFSKTAPSPAVSVIIPAYNYAHYLPQAIESVLQQDYPAFELIVVDDGSTDNTAEVAAEYGDSIRYVCQKNAGLPAARNTGIRHARHPFVGFLDADDRLLPGLLTRAMRTLRELPGDFALVAFRSVLIDSDGRPMETKDLMPGVSREVTCRDVILKSRFGTTGLVGRKAVFEECGYFDETLRSSEDRDMWIRISARQHRLYLCGERLVCIRRHTANMSRNSARMKANMSRVIGKAYRSGAVSRANLPFWLRVVAMRHFQTAWMYAEQGRRAKAVGDLLISLALWPWFGNEKSLNEPALFRLRALRRFLIDKVH